MKDCEEYSIHIQLFVDNALSCQDLGELRDHLQGCVACRQQVYLDRDYSCVRYTEGGTPTEFLKTVAKCC